MLRFTKQVKHLLLLIDVELMAIGVVGLVGGLLLEHLLLEAFEICLVKLIIRLFLELHHAGPS